MSRLQREITKKESSSRSVRELLKRENDQMNYSKMTKAELIEELNSIRFEAASKQSNTNTNYDQRLINEEQNNSEELFQTLANTTKAAIFIFLGNNLTYVNTAAMTITGFTENELLSFNFWDIIHPDQRELVMKRGLARQEGVRLPDRYEVKILTKQGEVRWVDFTASLISIKGTDAILGTAVDITAHKQKDIELQNISDWNEAIIEGSRDAIFISDVDANFVRVNKAAVELTGYTKVELLAMKIPDLHQKQDLGAYKRFHKSIINGQEIITEAMVLRKDGKKVDTEFNNKCIAVGGQKFMHTVARDITNRKQVEMALIESEERYRAVVQDQTELICRFKPDGTLTFVNDAYCRFFDKKPENLIGRNWLSFLPEKDRKMALLQFTSLSQENPVSTYEHQVESPTGEILWQEWTDRGIFDDLGNPQEFQSVGRNINERKVAEEALFESESSLRKAQEVAHIGNWQRHVPTDELKWSDEVYRIFGLKPGELKPSYKLFLSMVHPEDQKSVKHALDIALEGGEPYAIDHRIVHPDGIERIVNEQAQIVFDEEDNPLLIIGTVQDITERKKKEEELQESEERFRALFEHCPISIWEEDFSEVKEFIGNLRRKRVTDFRRYFDRHPEAVTNCMQKVKLLDFNQATLEIYKIKSKEELFFGLSKVFTENSVEIFKEELIAFAEGKCVFESDAENKTVNGEIIQIHLKCSIAPGYEDTWSKVFVSIADITKRKQTEKALFKSEQKLRSIIDYSKDVFYIHDTQHRLQYISHQSKEIIGYKPQEMMVKWMTFVTDNPINEKGIKCTERAIKTGRKQKPYELEIKRKDGDLRIVEIDEFPVKDETGNVVGVSGVLRDITQQKEVERAIHESEERYRRIIEDQSEFIVRWLPNGIRTFVNDSYCQYFGIKREEAIGTSFFPLISEEYHEAVQQRIALLNSQNPVSSGEHKIVKLDGSVGWNQWTDRALFDDQGELVEYQSVGRDITEQKQAVKALQESENRYRAVSELTSDYSYAYRVEPNGALVNEWVTGALFQLTGFTSEELRMVGGWEHLIHPDDIDIPKDQLNVILSNQAKTIEYRIVAKDGQVRWMRDYARPRWDETEGRVTHIEGAVKDITERKLAEERIRKSEQKLAEAQAIAHIGSWEWDVGTGQVEWSDEVYRIFGSKPGDFQPCIDSVMDRFHPDDQYKHEELIKHLTETSDNYSFDARILLPDCSERCVFSTSYAKRDDEGKLIRIIGTVQDITERKQIEVALSASEQKLRSIIDHSKDVFYIHNTHHELQYVSPQSKDTFGYSPREMMVKWMTLVTDNPMNEKGLISTERAIKTGRKQKPYLLEIKRKDGILRTVEIDESPVKDESGNVVRISGVLRDITQQIESEKALQESEFFLKESQKVSNLGSYVFDIKTGLLSGSEVLNDIFGVDESDKKDINAWLQLVHPEHRKQMEEYLSQNILTNHEHFNKEYKIIRQVDNKERWVHGLGELRFDDTGEPVKMIGTIQDITERKKAEMAMRESENRLSLAVEGARLGLWDQNYKTNEIIRNDYWSEMLGYKPGEIKNRYDAWKNLIYSEDLPQVDKMIQQHEEKGYPVFDVVHRMYAKDGSLKWIHNWGKVVERDDEGKPVRALGVHLDITERKQAEEILKIKLHQLEAIANFSKKAVSGDPIPVLMQTAITSLSEILSAKYVKILELLPDRDKLLLRVGVGWKKSLVGTAIVSTGKNSQAGFTLKTNQPVIVEDFKSESRFSVPKLLHDHKITSGMSVVIGEAQKPFGVLGVHTPEKRKFSNDDVHFLQSIANILAETIERQKSEEKIKYQANLLQNVQDVIYSTDNDFSIISWNQAAENIYGWKSQEVKGKSLWELIRTEFINDNKSDVIAEFEQLGMWQGEVIQTRKDGKLIHIMASMSALRDEKDRRIGVVGINFDLTNLKRIEQELSGTQTWLKLAVQAANIGFWEWNFKTNQTYLSPEWKEMIGYDDHEIPNHFDEWTQRLHPEDRDRSINLQQSFVENPWPNFSNEFRLRHKDNSYRWILSQASLVYDESGMPTSILGSHVDITDQKIVEEKLKERLSFEELLADLSKTFINLPSNEVDLKINEALQKIGVFMDVDRCFIDQFSEFNKSFKMTHRWTHDGADMDPGHFEILYDTQFPNYTKRILNKKEIVLSSLNQLNEEWSNEKQYFKRAGIKSFSIIPLIAGAHVVGSFGVVSTQEEKIWSQQFIDRLRLFSNIFANTIARKRMEGSLKESRENHQRIVENIHDALVIDDKDGRVIFANDQFLDLFGFSKKQIGNLYIKDYVAPEWQDKLITYHNNRIQGKRVRTHYEYVGISREGIRKWLEVTVSKIKKNGEIIGTQSIIRDITQRKKAEEELQLSNNQLEKFSEYLNNAMEEDRKRISREIHDVVGQSLSLLQVDLTLLEKECLKNEIVEQKLNSMSNLVDHTINEIQKISKELRPTLLDNIGLAAAIEWQVESICKDVGMHYEYEIEPQEFLVSQETAITCFRIVQEALTNVIRHAQATEFKLKLIKKKYIELHIYDNGIGIKPIHVQDTNSMGLIGIKERVRLLKGTVSFTGDPQNGTYIYVQLPIK